MVKIIIVEDDLMVAEINKQYILKACGNKNVEVFNNGRDALEYIENNHVDLAILDLYMPNISGLKLLRKIREKKLPIDIIMVTAANDRETLDTALKLGVLDYLIKPFKYDRFEIAVNKFLNKHNIMKEDKRFTQSDIDKILNNKDKGSKFEQNNVEINKGLQTKTLNFIMEELKNKVDVFLTSEEIGDIVGISRVTVRRYMNYLIEENRVVSIVDYNTGGRPSVKYKYINDV